MSSRAPNPKPPSADKKPKAPPSPFITRGKEIIVLTTPQLIPDEDCIGICGQDKRWIIKVSKDSLAGVINTLIQEGRIKL